MPAHARTLARQPLPWLYLVLAMLALVLAVFVTAWWAVDRFLHSHEVFRIQRVELDVPEGELRRRVEQVVQHWQGANYWEVRQQRTQAEQAIAALPPVQEVSIHTRPPRLVTVHVVRRTPWGQLSARGHYFLLDRQGVLFEIASKPWRDLPCIYGIDARPSDLKQPLDSSAAYAVLQCLGAAERLRAQRLPVELRRISVSPEGILQVRWGDGLLVRLGAPFDLEEKLKTVLELREALADSHPVEYIDVSALEVPVWKPPPEG